MEEEHSYRFTVGGSVVANGRVYAKSKEEALKLIQAGDYDDIIDEDIELNDKGVTLEDIYDDDEEDEDDDGWKF